MVKMIFDIFGNIFYFSFFISGFMIIVKIYSSVGLLRVVRGRLYSRLIYL